MAKRLMTELRTSEKVKIIYGLDQMANIMDGELPIYSIDEKLPKVDAIVVTIISEFAEIRETIRKKLIV